MQKTYHRLFFSIKNRGNPESNPDYRVDKVKDESIQRRIMFLQASIRASVENNFPPIYPL